MPTFIATIADMGQLEAYHINVNIICCLGLFVAVYKLVTINVVVVNVPCVYTDLHCHYM